MAKLFHSLIPVQEYSDSDVWDYISLGKWAFWYSSYNYGGVRYFFDVNEMYDLNTDLSYLF